MLEEYIEVYDNVIHPQVISKLIRFANKSFDNKKFEEGKVGIGDGMVWKEKRDVDILPLSIASESLTNVHWCNFLGYSFTLACEEYRKKYPLVHPVRLEAMQLLRYKKQGHYKYHIDNGADTRTLSIVMMLNNDYQGGELNFKVDKKEKTIPVKAGRIIVFPSNFCFPHKVAPVTKGVRYSLVSWGH